MSYAVMTIAIDDMAVDPLGAKEAAAMALEHLGAVRVLQVEAYGPEQLEIGGAAPTRPPVPRTLPGWAKPPGGQAPAARAPAAPRRGIPTAMACCLTCGQYRKEYGRDGAGRPYWGRCRKTGMWIYNLKERCAAWKAEA